MIARWRSLHQRIKLYAESELYSHKSDSTSEGCSNMVMFFNQYLGLRVSNVKEKRSIYSVTSGYITYRSFIYSDNL